MSENDHPETDNPERLPLWSKMGRLGNKRIRFTLKMIARSKTFSQTFYQFLPFTKRGIVHELKKPISKKIMRLLSPTEQGSFEHFKRFVKSLNGHDLGWVPSAVFDGK